MIPLIDLSLPKNVKDQIKKEIGKVIDSKSYILGEQLGTFEKEFAKFVGVKYAIGVASGTDALRLSLRALGIGNDDKVLTVALTSSFTAIAIIEEGAIPVFCDVDEATWTIDPADVEKKIDKKTKAIIPVHLFGTPCNMAEIMKIAKIYKLKVIEDACQAHGAEISGKKVGTFGDASAFSFYPTKNLGAMGDAGMVTTNNPKIAKIIRLLRHGGQTKRFWHRYQGINSRLDEIQAAVLEVKLKFLERHNKKRVKMARRYIEKLRDLPCGFQQISPSVCSVFHLFVIETVKRDVLKSFLAKNGIVSDIYYPYPTHIQPAFKKYKNNNLKITNKLVKQLLAIPIYPNLTIGEQDFIINTIRNFFKKN